MLLIGLLLQSAAAAAPVPAAPTVQQRFDAATAAADDGRCADAVPAFDALEKVPAIQRSEMARVTLGLRRARCLVDTDRDEEAIAAVRLALPVLERRGTEFADEIADARGMLARWAKRNGDYDGAIRENEARLTAASGAARLPLLRALIDLTMFDHDGRALRHAEEARRLAAAPDTSKRLVAVVQTFYARVLLNEGRKAEAYAVLKDSLAKQGGLGLKVGMADLQTRSDLALAALVNNDREEARRYLAFTGAGRLKDGLAPASQMVLPQCGTDGLKPEDFAIVELSLADNGSVHAVSPIYVGGNRATALAFVRAVRGWSWRPEVAAKIPPLFRALTRVEVRCTKGLDERLSLSRILLDAVPDWSADEQGSGTPWAGMSAAAALPLQRAALARAGSDRAARLRALVALIDNRVLPVADYRTMVPEAAALAESLGAPAPLLVRLASVDADEQTLRMMLTNQAVLADPLSSAVLRVAIASPRVRGKVVKDAPALLDAAIAQPGLPERHPIKVRALLLKANMLGAAGNTADAQAALARTGLTAEQCSVAGVVPALKRGDAGSHRYPEAARDMGFEGWVRSEYDIAANGRTIAPRAIAAYPPFIFNDAANGYFRDARYASSFQPDASVACSANANTINFVLPK